MEPADLTPAPSPDDRALDEALRRALATPALPDDGFTRGVLAALPPVRPAQGRRRSWLLAGAGLAALVSIAAVGVPLAEIGRAFGAGASGWRFDSTLFWLVATGVASAAWALRDEVRVLLDL